MKLPTIEHGIAITPSVREGKENAKTIFLRNMKPGESFELPWEKMNPWAAAASKYKGEFTCRRMANGNHRMWKLHKESASDLLRGLEIGETISGGIRSAANWHSSAKGVGIKIAYKEGNVTRIS